MRTVILYTVLLLISISAGAQGRSLPDPKKFENGYDLWDVKQLVMNLQSARHGQQLLNHQTINDAGNCKKYQLSKISVDKPKRLIYSASPAQNYKRVRYSRMMFRLDEQLEFETTTSFRVQQQKKLKPVLSATARMKFSLIKSLINK